MGNMNVIGSDTADAEKDKIQDMNGTALCHWHHWQREGHDPNSLQGSEEGQVQEQENMT